MKKKDKKLLLWVGALGVGIWWLTRPKATPQPPTKSAAAPIAPTYKSQQSTASVGYPYRDAVV